MYMYVRKRINALLAHIKAGFSWATDNWLVIVAGLSLYITVNVLVAWHFEIVLCEVFLINNTFGVSYIVIGASAIVLLLHETRYIWKNERLKRPIGFFSVWYIYYLIFQAPWSLISVFVMIPLWADIAIMFICIISGIVIVVFGCKHARKVCITTYRIPARLKTTKWRIALISDIHIGAFVNDSHIAKIVEKINILSPDVVLIAGDLIDDDPSFLADATRVYRVTQKMRSITSRYGVYMTLGNHDPGIENGAFCSFLYRCGFKLLCDECIELPELIIAGRLDSGHSCRKPIKEIIPDAKTSKPVIIVDHNPKHIDEAGDYDIDFVLSGHTHAGQFFPATMATRLTVGRHRHYGCYKLGNTHSIVTSGAGFFNLPVRIGTNSEIVNIIMEADCKF